MRTKFSLFGLGLLLACSPALAQRELKEIPNPDPELERKTFVLPEGFEVSLYAGDPQIAKPVQMNFGPDGKLWIASSAIYPQIEPGHEAKDRILVVEDTDHDGVAEKTTVFADGLLIPSAVIPGDGGAYVGASTDLFFFKDTDGDGRADEKKYVLSGFGTEDTHHTIHTLRWGPEQLLYFKQSIYIHSHLETPWGVKRLNAGGTWQFRPDDLKLDVFDRGLVNSWGMAWDDYGTTFATDGAGGEGINYIVPGASYLTAFGADRILSGLNPGSPKHCGLEIVGGPGFPPEWQQSLVTNDFRGHRVCRFVLKDVGSGFLSQEQQEVIKSDHPAFRPIDVKQGPDGALYIADWYNPIIQHGEVDFRDPRRDHVHGRIWRVTWKGAPKPAAPLDYAALSTAELLSHLTSDDRFVRQSVKRTLAERGAAELVPPLKTWARSLDNTDPKFPRHRLEALWLYQAVDVPEWELLDSLVRSDNPAARAGAVRVIGHWLDRAPANFDAVSPLAGTQPAVRKGQVNPVDLLRLAMTDAHPRVKLEAVRVLGKVPDPRAAELAMTALDTADIDVTLDYALWLTARELQPIWQPALTAGTITFGGKAKQIAFACKAAGSQAAVPSLLALLSAGKVEAADLSGVLEVVGDFGSPDDLQALLALADASKSDTERSTSILNALVAAHRRRQAVPAAPLGPLGDLLTSDRPEILQRAAELAGRYHVEQLYPVIKQLAANENPQILRGAIAGLEAFGGDDAIQELARLANDPVAWQPAIGGLLTHRPAEAAQAFTSRLKSDDPLAAGAAGAGAIAQVTQTFLQRKDGPDLLVKALENQSIDADRAKSALRVVASSGQAQDALSQSLRAAGKLDAQPQKLTAEEFQKLLAEVREHGNAANGEAIFRREELTCFKCHAIGDAGGVVGPNLVSLGGSSQPDYILESLVDPNAKIKENFHTVVVATDDGDIVTGIKVRETGQDLILRDAEDREIAVPLNKIDAQMPGASIMPAGLIDKLTRHEMVDLVAFLSSVGRVPDFTVGQSPIARRWDVLAASQDTQHQFYRLGLQEVTRDNPVFKWQRVYSRVNGELPVTALPDMKMLGQSKGNRGLTFVRCEIEAAADGESKLKIEAPADTRCWLDDQPVEAPSEAVVKLKAGKHRLTLAINQESPPAPLRVSLVDPGTAAAKFVGGK